MRRRASCGSAVLLILTWGVSSCGELPNRWMPRWKVGDWWIVQWRSQNTVEGQGEPEWSVPVARYRCEVTGEDVVNGHSCFVVEKRGWPIFKYRPEARTVLHFRKENLQLVRLTEFFYLLGELMPPRSKEFRYTERVGIAGRGEGLFSNFPAFPLICQGPEADSLAQIRESPTRDNFVSQVVSREQLEQLGDLLRHPDTLLVSEGACYLSVLEAGGYSEAHRRRIVSRTDQVWVPGFPWVIYEEVSEKGQYVVEQTGMEKWPRWRSWLVDWSGLHSE